MYKKYTKKQTVLLLCGALAAAVIVAVLLLIICSRGEKTPVLAESDDPYALLEKNTYDKSAFFEENGLKNYRFKDGEKALVGIDVSEHQEDIDWSALSGKIDFAFIRVGYRGYEYGLLNPDDRLHDNISGALKAKIPVGVYFFSQAISEDEAVAEAKYVIDSIKDYNVTWPVVYDMERLENARAEALSAEERTRFAGVFCSEIKKAGYTPLIYGNVNWLLYEIDMPSLKNYGFWLAEYDDLPEFPYNFDIWQYTDTGKIPGVEGKFDLNVSFKDFGKAE